MIRIAALAAAALAIAACTPRDANTWHAAEPGGSIRHEVHTGELVQRRLAVAFAPVAIGPLRTVWPEARDTFAYDLADRIDVLGKKADADGYAAGDLPGSDDQAWTRWPVTAARGADYVALTTITELKVVEGSMTGSGSPVTATALAEMRVLDTHGNVVFQRRGRGDWSGMTSPKLIGPANRPETRVAWLACSNAVGALLEWLEKRNEAVADGPAPTAERSVAIEVASDPPGADVLVDGIFRGNTPCTLTLPARPLLMRIERRGYEAWEHRLTPEAGIKIRPALEK